MSYQATAPKRSRPKPWAFVGLVVFVMLVLNLGLHTLLAPPEIDEEAGPALAPIQEELVYRETFADSVDDLAWTPISGSWQVERVLVQRQPAGEDMAIRFRDILENYTLRVVLRHLEGAGGGVLFNMPQEDSTRGAHMVRFGAEGNTLFIFWGYFDENGEFIGQGSAPLFPPIPPQHVLEIDSGEVSYTVRLNGRTVAERVPLESSRGHIGLVATQAAVAFDSVDVFGAEALRDAVAPLRLGDMSLRAISGDWRREGNSLQQFSPESTDFIMTSDVFARAYTLSVDVTAQSEEAGGGVIFHMPEQEDPRGAHMVRFAQGGREVFWGHYDAEGNFVGQGSAELPDAQPGVSQRLTLMVGDADYGVWVNESQVAEGIPLQRSEGWLGLLSFGGPVGFGEFNLQLGGETTP